MIHPNFMAARAPASKTGKEGGKGFQVFYSLRVASRRSFGADAPAPAGRSIRSVHSAAAFSGLRQQFDEPELAALPPASY